MKNMTPKLFFTVFTLLLVTTLTAQTEFITTWKTDNAGPSNDNQITIPTTGTGYNYTVEWGDGISESGLTANATHTYAIPGTYTVTITGAFPRIYFNNSGDRLKILSIEQWGTIAWTSMNEAFEGCSNLVLNATDAPDLTNATQALRMFRGCSSLNTDLNNWNVSTLTSIGGMFEGATNFNGNISNWNVSNVNSFSTVFKLTSFNRDISNWIVSSGANFSDMFQFNTAFNQPIGNWNVSSGIIMTGMFHGASNFNESLASWNVENVRFMNNMLSNSGMTTANYDATLIGWSNLPLLSSNVTLGAGSIEYCAALVERQNIIDTYNWTITDGGFNGSCMAPIAMCQNSTLQLDASGNATITAAQIDNGSTAPAGIASIALDITQFNCSNIGANTVTLTITDNNGTTDTCTATVIVEDIIAPVVSCQDITIQLDAAGMATIEVSQLNTGASDNCSILDMYLSQDTFDCTNIGANTVVLTVEDDEGNTGTCTSTVTVQDIIAPGISCNSDFSINTDPGQCNSVVTFGTPTGSDNCNVTVTQTMGLPSGSTFSIGTHAVEFTATDASGNTNSCSFVITVVDNELPIAVCQDITVQLDATGTAVITANDVDNGSSDNCGIASVMINNTIFNCANVGANSVILTVTDVNGNIATCNATVTVEEAIAPVAVCQNITVQLNAIGNATVFANDVDNGSSDNCGIASLSLSKSNFNCSDIGSNDVTFTVTDTNGNTSSCIATITVEDNIAPVIQCNDITIDLDANGVASINPEDMYIDTSFPVNIQGVYTLSSNIGTTGSDDVAFYNYNPVTDAIELTDGINFGINGIGYAMDVDPITGQVYALATPGSNNNFRALFEVDLTNQSLTFVAQIVSTTGSTKPQDMAFGADGTLYFIFQGGIVNTYTIGSGNISAFTNVPSAGASGITYDFDNNRLLYADSNPVNLYEINTTTGSVNPLFTFTANSNSGSCSAQGIEYVGDDKVLVGTTGPIVNCDALYTVDLNTQIVNILLNPTGSFPNNKDLLFPWSVYNCGTNTVTLDATNFDCTNLGANTVTVTATDASGNVSTCMATVTVQDTMAPMVTCQDITIQLDSLGSAAITAADVTGVSTDNCGVASSTIDIASFNCSNIGANNVMLTVTDASGNVSSCMAVVTVEDVMAPELTCIADQTVEVENGQQYEVPDYVLLGEIIAVDNCTDPVTMISQSPVAGTLLDPGVYSISFIAEDAFGNAASCEFELTVEELLDIEDFKIAADSLKLFPNPSSNYITLSNPMQLSVKTWALYDITGRLIKKQELEKTISSVTIDISELASSNYIILINIGDKQITKQLVKE